MKTHLPKLRCAAASAVLWICLSGGALPAVPPGDHGARPRTPYGANATELLRGTAWQGGAEVRTGRFIVFCTTGRQDAGWTVRHLENVFSDVALLADHWTDVHRRPAFETRPVGVLITDRPLPLRRPATPGPRRTNFGPDVSIALRPGSAGLREHLPQLRREAVRAFFRIARQDSVLPEWVQTGLAAYLSDGHIATRPAPAEPVSTPIPNGRVGHQARPAAPDNMPSLQDPRGAALWVRYLLEGDDARHAPDFFAAMAATISPSGEDPFSPADREEGVMQFRPRGSAAARSPLDQLTAAPAVGHNFTQWLADPKIGQPIVQPIPGDMPPQKRFGELVLILKLARRFPPPAANPIRPRINEFGKDRPGVTLGETTSGQAASFSALYGRLTDPSAPPWATIDTDGRLLCSDDRERLAAIFTNPRRQYRTYREDGHDVLEAEFGPGETYRAWLEENPENPKRPIVRVQRKPVGAVSSQSSGRRADGR